MTRLPQTARRWLALLALAACLPAAGSAQRPGEQPNGTVLLPNGWTISPAGRQIPLSTLPMSLALSPNGRYLLALQAGYLEPSVSVVELESEQIVGRVALPDAWLGLAFHPDGGKAYAGGGSRASVFELNLEDGKISMGREFPVIEEGKRRPSDLVGDVAISPDGRFLYAANVFRGTVTVMNAQTGFVLKELNVGERPYRLRLTPDGEALLVSRWSGKSVAVYATSDGRLLEMLSVGLHPTDLLLVPGAVDLGEERPEIAARLFVACANTNSYWVYGVTEGLRFELLEIVSLAPSPNAPAGSMPTALAASEDGDRIFVVSSGNNMIAVGDIRGSRTEPLGAIPTGWFPTAAAVAADGRLFYLSGKGYGTYPLPDGPDPTDRGKESSYVAAVQTGGLGIVPPVDDETLDQLTARVVENTPYHDRLLLDAGIPAGSAIPNTPGGGSPIEHVIYVIKENRTYDQVLGEMEVGEGNAGLARFGRDVTPNHHKLAEEFVLFDNFYAAGDVSADGQNWATAALANDYVEKMWPAYQAGRRSVYDFEGGEPTASPTAGHLWSNALSAGLSVRNYGMWAEVPDKGELQAVARDPYLAPHTNVQYRAFDLATPDNQRVDEFLRELRQFDEQGTMPRLLLVRLPNDHTAGRSPGHPTARSMMAEHDWALGRLVEGVTNSRFWEKTAIFVIEDDAQDGADHLDSHRSPAFVISPYAKRKFVDSTFYNTLSVLRTIELILGLRPMTQFDAAARPMAAAFTAEPDRKPYRAVRPEAPLDEANPAGGPPPRRVEREQAPETPSPAALARAASR